MTISKPDLTRIWASSAPPSNVVDPDVTIPGKVAAGWLAEVPPFEHFNYLQKWFTQGLAHINERGIPEWDADTVYPVGAFVTGSDGQLYKSKSLQNGNNPISDPVNWDKLYINKAGINSVTDMINSTSVKIGDKVVTYANQNGAAIRQEWTIVDALSGVDNGGDYIDLVGSGLQAKQIFGVTVCPTQFGAVPNDDTAPIALINREAFRECLKSYSDSYATVASQDDLYIVEPQSGDYNLSNGFTVPTGMTLRASIGQVRIKILGATVDADPKIALCTTNQVIDRATHTLSNSVGKYVTAPPAHVDNIYLNPQNSNTALVCAGAGYKVGKIWAQGETAIKFVGTDGIVDELIIEDGTVNGMNFAGGSNHVIGTVYTFLVDNPVIFTGDCSNIDIDTIQCNFTEVSCLQTNDSLDIGRVHIGKLVCNQNAQFGTFTSVIRTRSNSSDITIGHLDARNYNGLAVNNETGLGNRVHIKHAKLRQTPNVTGYTVGTTAAGIRANNSSVTVDYLDAAGLSDSPLRLDGTFAASIEVNKAKIGTFTTSDPVCDITNTSSSSTCKLFNIDNQSSKELFNAQATVDVIFRDCIKPFQNQTESSRIAIKIPFSSNTSVYEVTVTANTNNVGNGNYRRIKRINVSHETSFNSALKSVLTQTTIANTGIYTGFTPDISTQVDFTSVGTGAEIAHITNGYLVLSVPDTYTNVMYNVTQLAIA